MMCFVYKTMFWQCSIEDYDALFQGNFANDMTYSWRDL